MYREWGAQDYYVYFGTHVALTVLANQIIQPLGIPLHPCQTSATCVLICNSISKFIH